MRRRRRGVRATGPRGDQRGPDAQPPARPRGSARADRARSWGEPVEREALLHTLSLLPEPDRFLSTAVEACRSNVQTVFEAIACENPYPVRHFPELSFNQMVMKAIFIGIPLPRIVGLLTRVAPTLVRMSNDYAQERMAAGRPVPADIQLITSGG